MTIGASARGNSNQWKPVPRDHFLIHCRLAMEPEDIPVHGVALWQVHSGGVSREVSGGRSGQEKNQSKSLPSYNTRKTPKKAINYAEMLLVSYTLAVPIPFVERTLVRPFC